MIPEPEQQTLDFMSITTTNCPPELNNGYSYIPQQYVAPLCFCSENTDLKSKLKSTEDTVKKLNKVIKLLVETRGS